MGKLTPYGLRVNNEFFFLEYFSLDVLYRSIMLVNMETVVYGYFFLEI